MFGTCAGAAYDTVVNNWTAVDCNLQAVVCVVVLGGFIIRVELQGTQQESVTIESASDNSPGWMKNLTLTVMYPTYASSEPSMNTNVESLVFSMMTFSATFPGARK